MSPNLITLTNYSGFFFFLSQGKNSTGLRKPSSHVVQRVKDPAAVMQVATMTWVVSHTVHTVKKKTCPQNKKQKQNPKNLTPRKPLKKITSFGFL